MSFLRLTSVRKCYGDVLAIDGIGLALAEGSHTAIVGPSASGKSTLLRVIAGFEEPDAGEVMLAGETLKTWASIRTHHRHGPRRIVQFVAVISVWDYEPLTAESVDYFRVASRRLTMPLSPFNW